jgi:hypothetical protein
MAMEYRMSCDEFTEGGVGIDEAIFFAKTVRIRSISYISRRKP